ncbi:hypothetical protein GOBAR_DD30458 [Gossypium barbadense]|nr:hypothetical protein GOBAR_DD30458 [Gossypium barbadense]
MGSISSQRRSASPSPPPVFNSSRYRVIAAFCPKEAGPSTNVFNCIQCYNPCNNTWEHVSFIPNLRENHVLKGFVMVSLGESVYVIGGRLWNKRKPRDSNEIPDVDVEVSALVLRYNVRWNKWSKCASLGTPRYDFACCVCNEKIYVAGGKSGLNSTRGMTSAEVYDPVTCRWTDLPSMSSLRYKCVGRCSAEVFHVGAEKWDLEAGMWQLDVPPNQIVDVDGKLFSSGDCLNPWKGHIEAYDENLNMWTEVDGSRFNPPISAMERLYLTMAPIGTQLYFFAGYRKAEEPTKTLSVVYIFDTLATVDAWRSLEPTEEEGENELCSHCCVVQL